MQSEFRKARFGWLSAVMASAILTPSAKIVADRLVLQFANAETQQCNPCIELIGESVCLSRSSVKRALAELERAGFLKIERARGRGKSSAFSFLRLEEFAGPKPTENGSNVTPFPVKKRAADGPFSKTEKGSEMRRKGFSGEPAYRTIREPKKRAPVSRSFPQFEVALVDGRGPDPWERWMEANGYPPLARIPALQKRAVRGGVMLCRLHPPTDPIERDIVIEYLQAVAQLHPSYAEKGRVG